MDISKIKKGIFIKPYGNDFLLIKTLPWTVVLVDKENIEKIKNIILLNCGLGNKKLYDELKCLGFLSDVNPDEFIDKNYVTILFVFSTACNLACPHCMAGRGDYGFEHQNMSFDIAKKSIDYQAGKLRKLILSEKYEEVDLGLFFFGGEPLLNQQTLIKVVRYSNEVARDLNSSKTNVSTAYSLSTNGVLINDEIAEFLSENNIEVILSIDGPTHNVHRPLKDGGDSLKKAVNAYKILKRHNVNIRINTVILPEDALSIDKRIDWFKKYVFVDNHDNTRMTFSFVRGPVGKQRNVGKRYNCSYSAECINMYIESMKKISNEGIYTYEAEMLRKIEVGGTYLKCSAGIERICVVPNGNVYPCQSFIDDKFLIGNIASNGFEHINSDVYQFFMKRNIYCLEPCNDCYLQSVCGLSFDCASHSYYDLGDFYKVDIDTCKAGFNVQDFLFDKIISNE